jgi:nucleoside-diphosphate-sugar epimerase
MDDRHVHAVTGAFGYSGRYIATRLLEAGKRVITLTNSPERANPFGERVRAFPFNFDRPDELARSLEGVDVLYNTYWVRFNHPTFQHSEAVRNTLILFDACRRAGVRRIVHVSITNPSLDSRLEYFRGKAELEKALVETGISHAIVRPTVLFGREDILVNNIAWLLRRFPVFGVFGDGRYKLQPIYVDDLAKVCAAQSESDDNVVINAIGPETFEYRDMVREIARAIGVVRPIVPIPPGAGLLVGKVAGRFLGDVLITREEIDGLMAGLLYVDAPPAGHTALTAWARANAETLGRSYASELRRRHNRAAEYLPAN